MSACPICKATNAQPFAKLQDKVYHACSRCGARWLDRSYHLSLEEERAHYGLHQNSLQSPDYRAFLNRLAGPMLASLAPQQRGLDFGCGPAPLLARILEEQGHSVRVYDPIYAPDPLVFDQDFDFIVSSETVEHFCDPATEFAALDRMLKPGGTMGIMTSFYPGDEQFAQWYYRRDPTHVVFYTPQTFGYLGQKYGWECRVPARNVVLIEKMPQKVWQVPKREELMAV